MKTDTPGATDYSMFLSVTWLQANSNTRQVHAHNPAKNTAADITGNVQI